MSFECKSIIVVGSGLVGSACVAALVHCGHHVTWLQQKKTQASNDQRPISLAYPTITFLKNLHVWPLLEKQAAPIHQVHISEQNMLGSLLLKASHIQCDALGYVVPYQELETALHDYASQSAKVTTVIVSDITAIKESHEFDYVDVTFLTQEGETTVAAHRLIAADGVNSRCRSLLNIKADEVSQDDVAVTASLSVAHPHHGRAYERFTRHGVLALLPTWAAHQYRLVWTVNRDYFQKVGASFIPTMLHDAFHSRIGSINEFDFQECYPLKTVRVDQQITEHVVLLGDSAHRLYPLAAQGFNLAVRDTAMLIDVINQGSPLSAYIKNRESDQRFTITLTSGLDLIFGLHLPLLNHVRSMGLFIADALPFVKQRLIRQITGQTSKQPSLLCVE